MLTVLRKYRQLTFDNYHIQHLSIGERCIWYFFYLYHTYGIACPMGTHYLCTIKQLKKQRSYGKDLFKPD